jgi:hypothetical protein
MINATAGVHRGARRGGVAACGAGTATETAGGCLRFGGKAGMRNNQPVVDIPGVQIRFAKAEIAQAPTKGRVLDHFGFGVKDHAAFVKKIEAEGIKLDEPPRKNAATGSTSLTSPIRGARASNSSNARR